MNYTKGKDYVIDSQQRAVIRVPEADIAKYLSAPELYEALKKLVDYYDNWQAVHYQYLSEAHDILEKLDGLKI